MSAAAGRGPRLLPPLARGRDWIAAGFGAGLCLGAAESLGLHVQGVELPPAQALALVAGDAAAVAILSIPLALASALSRRRPSHSRVAGGIVGAVLLAPAVGRAIVELQSGPTEGVPTALLAGAGVALLGGLLAAWAGDRLERMGIPISGPPLWSAVALLVAAAGTFRAGGSLELTPTILIALGAVVLVLALLAAFLAVLAAHRAAVIPWPWARSLLVLALVAAGTALAPWLLPWIVMDPPAAPTAARAPDVIAIALGAFPASDAPAVAVRGPERAGPVAPNLTLLATAGVLYRRAVARPQEKAGFDWLRLPDGVPVARVLRARGYLARLAGESSAWDGLPPGVDRGEGRGRAEEREAAVRATTGGALLAAIGAGRLGPVAGSSAGARISAEARRRVASARARDPERPLLLFVDYRGAERNASLLDDEVGALLDFLADLGIEENARILVTWSVEEASSDPSADPAGALVLQALLRPEPAATAASRGELVPGPVLASEIAARVAGQQAAAAESP